MSIESWSVLAAIYAVLIAAWIIAKPLKEQPKPRPYAGLKPTPEPKPRPELSAYTAEGLVWEMEQDVEWRRNCNQKFQDAIRKWEDDRNDQLPN